MALVTLISHTPDPERVVASAAKLCYSPSTIDETSENLTPEKISSFVKMLASMGHESPLEHINFTFGIEGVSRALLAQLTRHRIASYSVQSQRYVNLSNFEYVIPPEIESIPEAKKNFTDIMNYLEKQYENLTNILKKKHMENQEDTSPEIEKACEKTAIEDARYILPNACTTKIICTFNARSLLNFFNHRCCNRAQWEIRNLALEMLKLVKKEAPNIFYKAGPSCIKGTCPEGKMSCKKSSRNEEIIRKFIKIRK